MSQDGADVLVLGVGNILWADEGFGVRCAEAFAQRYAPADGVEVIDGGTQGLSLVNDVAAARRIIIFDAVDAKKDGGALVTMSGDSVPRFLSAKKMSLHQTSMMEILSLAELMADGLPDELHLIGCQPVDMEDYGGGLTPLVAAQVDPAIDRAVALMESWGFPLTPADAAQPIMPVAVGWQPYEIDRPSADKACRIGDDRVLSRLATGDSG